MRISLVASLALCITLGFGFPGVGQDREKLSPEEKAKLQESLAEIEQAEGTIRRLMDSMDKKSFEVAALAPSLVQDPQACVDFVRNRTVLEPYRGLLRGAEGTLVSRGGNSLDRSTLLAELLRDKDREIRIVRGRLSSDDARELLRTEVRSVPRESLKEESMDLHAVGRELKWDPARLKQLQSKVEAREKESRKDLESRFAEDVRYLEDALNAAGVSLETPSSTEESDRVETLRDHFWVQWRSVGAEGWKDLDPQFEKGTRGTKPEPVALATLPNDLIHSVGIRLVLERIVSGKAEEKVLLESTLRTSDWMGKAITLSILPGDHRLDGLMTQATKTKAARLSVLDSVKVFQPILILHDRPVGGSPFDLSGQIYPVDETGNIGTGDLSKRGLKTAEEGLDDLLGKGKDRPHLSALRLEWILREPGKAPRTESRTIVDRVSPQDRSEGTGRISDAADRPALRRVKVQLLRAYSLAVTSGKLSPTFASWIAMKHIIRYLHLSKKELQARLRGQSVDWAEIEDATQDGILTSLMQYEHLRTTQMEAPSQGVWGFRPAASVVAYVVATEAGPKEALFPVRGYDILHNPVRVLPLQPEQESAARRASFLQGIWDTQVERVLTADPEGAVNTSNILRTAREQGIAVRTLLPKEPQAVDALELSLPVKSRVRGELASGHIVVIPTKTVPFGDREVIAWWRIHPETGRILGIGESGAGQGYTERLITFTVWRCSLFKVCALGMMLLGNLDGANLLKCAIASLAGGAKMAGIKHAEVAIGMLALLIFSN